MSVLTRIRIDFRTAVRLRIKDSYSWHRALWKVFPQNDTRDFLYRVDSCDGGFRLYLLSESVPQIPDWGAWETKRVPESFLGRPVYRFQLCANPTVKRKREGRKNGTRTAIYEESELKAWLNRKAEQGGFAVNWPATQIGPPINQPFIKKGRRGNHKRVDYQGLLAVENRERFKECFKKGIGSAKAFGFGLLVLGPAN
ncbi:type I-E CRISPR-associated protein Cas6/Cse3/CasE [Kiritimatiella glycovorans]|uniref:CRISPR system Cascade subunit CasE n=1 Tax=Kiritimatiella glycovorans TaxID=1307763 RepID=A0A0G3EKM6_9BACT|nr:type I-E CRISPR-associated protein Cas6/Cse3/CasE [Kiritimatiella glycovorans]AKJ65310.1 CRISPR system Cascade subunit CasE [Kiritimatiella glycovorans]